MSKFIIVDATDCILHQLIAAPLPYTAWKWLRAEDLYRAVCRSGDHKTVRIQLSK